MRKNIKKFAGIVLCIGMFTGCAQTPDSSLVKPKGSKAVDAYTEADDVSGSKGEASESKNDDGSESKTTIRNLIDAPQNYKSHVEDDSAKLVVNTDASVEIPEVEKISAISVTAAEVPQELLDRITNAFFSEAKLYTMDSYYVKTKDEIKKTLDELKEDVATGNLDPYNYGKLKKWASQICSFLTGITRCAKVLKTIIVQVILEMDIELIMHVP